MIFSSRSEPVSWFRDRYREGTLTIRPPYQRKPVWTLKQKTFLIESILLNLPVPEIYLHEVTSPEGLTKYAVVDGQQRITAVLQFLGAAQGGAEDEEFHQFALSAVEPSSEFYEACFVDLPDSLRARFYGYKLTMRVLEDATDSDVRDMFKRLNKFLTPLNAQELRNATYTGPFMQLVTKLAEDEYWTTNGLVTAAQIRRSKDLEFVSELLIGVMHGPQGSRSIEDYYRRYEDYDEEFPGQRQVRKRYTETFRFVQELFPDMREQRWSNLADFYSLFVALAQLLREGSELLADRQRLREGLDVSAKEVEARLADDEARVSREAVAYVRNVSRGASEKARRGERHLALLSMIQRTVGHSAVDQAGQRS